MPDVIFVQPRQDATTSRHVRPSASPGLRSALARSISGVTAASGQLSNVIPGPTGRGSRSSEGDITHLAVAARAAFSTTGAGIKIGVLSDGVRNLAASQAAGDLGPVKVIGPPAPCASFVVCDEGTAMLEIIHDLAPGAELYFASGLVSITSFADNIRALRAAGCDIIVDDLFYFVETPFQDGQAPGIISNSNGGVVIQAVKDVTASGALYFSSAGNSGNFNDGTAGAWEGDFADGGPTAGAPVGRAPPRLRRTELQPPARGEYGRADLAVLVRSARRLGERLRSVPLECRRDCRHGELDQHPERHAGSDRAGQPEPGQPAHRHRQEDGRAAPLPSSGDQPRAAAVLRLRA